MRTHTTHVPCIAVDRKRLWISHVAGRNMADHDLIDLGWIPFWYTQTIIQHHPQRHRQLHQRDLRADIQCRGVGRAVGCIVILDG